MFVTFCRIRYVPTSTLILTNRRVAWGSLFKSSTVADKDREHSQFAELKKKEKKKEKLPLFFPLKTKLLCSTSLLLLFALLWWINTFVDWIRLRGTS